MSDVEKYAKRADEIADLYDKSNREAGRPSWGPSEFMAGMIGDAGDLSKLVMAREGFREIEDVEAKIDHELDDLAWSYFELCRSLGRKPFATFLKTMDELEARFEAEK